MAMTNGSIASTERRVDPQTGFLVRPLVVRSPAAQHINSVPNIDFSDEEHADITVAVRRALADDRYALSLRLGPLKSALAKLDPASAPDQHQNRRQRRQHAPAVAAERGVER